MQQTPLEVVFNYYISQGGMVIDMRQFQMMFADWLSRIGQDFQTVYLFVMKQR